MPAFIFAVFIVMTISQTSYAGLGKEVPASVGFSQLCFLDMSPDLDVYGEICSGVLIDDQTIVTAAHCLDRGLPQKIYCGPEQIQVEVLASDVQIHPDYKSDVLINNIRYVVNDIAVLPLARSVPAEQVSLISLDDALTSEQCAFFGFSKMSLLPRSEKVKPRFGWTFSLQAMKWMDADYPIIQVQGLIGSGGLLEIGDSGGPLMCHHQGQWKLLGVSSSRDYHYNSLFTPVLNPGLKIRSKQPATQLVSQALRSDLVFKFQSHQAEYEKLLRKVNRVSQWLSFRPAAPLGEVLIDPLSDQELRIQNQTMANVYLATKTHVIEELLQQKDLNLRLEAFSQFVQPSTGLKASIGDLSYNYFTLKNRLSNDKAIGDLRVIGPSDYFTCHGELLCSNQELIDVEIDISDLAIFGFEGKLLQIDRLSSLN